MDVHCHQERLLLVLVYSSAHPLFDMGVHQVPTTLCFTGRNQLKYRLWTNNYVWVGLNRSTTKHQQSNCIAYSMWQISALCRDSLPVWAQASQNSNTYCPSWINVLICIPCVIAALECNYHMTWKAGQSVQMYFSLPLAPPTGNKKYDWLARLSQMLTRKSSGGRGVGGGGESGDTCILSWC